MSERTQQCYARSVRQLIAFYNKDPNEITEEKLKEYLLYRRNESKWSADTMKICYCGLKFFFIHVLQRKYPVFASLKPQREKRLPCVLTQEEVRQILGHVNTFHNYAFLPTVYTCGLRLQEALYLQVSDIDAERMLIHVHQGKGLGWMAHQVERQVPTHHFMITFTVPEEIRPFIRSHQHVAYNALFKASSETMKKLTKKAAISNHRIAGSEDGKVTFRYRKPKNRRTRVMELPAFEFIRRFLQHVLPSGFMKVRHYGFMNTCSGVSVGLVRAAVELLQGFDVKEPEIKKAEAEQAATRCPDCGGKLIYSYTILPHQMMSPPLPGLILRQQAVQRE